MYRQRAARLDCATQSLISFVNGPTNHRKWYRQSVRLYSHRHAPVIINKYCLSLTVRYKRGSVCEWRSFDRIHEVRRLYQFAAAYVNPNKDLAIIANSFFLDQRLSRLPRLTSENV